MITVSFPASAELFSSTHLGSNGPFRVPVTLNPECEEQLALLLEPARAAAWTLDLLSGTMTWSSDTRRVFGDRNPSPSTVDAFLARVHADDRSDVLTALSSAANAVNMFEAQFRLIDANAITRWVIARGRVSHVTNRMTGVLLDVTEHHQADADLRSLAGRLIDAHEQERARLARELHDDMGQQVALLSAELEVLRQRLAGLVPHVSEQTANLCEQVSQMGATLHHLSHALHPARLEHLGLPAALRSLATEVAKGTSLSVHADVQNLPSLDADVALCLYRIGQEALHNVVSHSGASNVAVALDLRGTEIVLTVSDDGVGFDADVVSARDSLGLVSMRERSRLVGGRLDVRSTPGTGTRVELRIPLTREAPAREPGGRRPRLVRRSQSRSLIATGRKEPSAPTQARHLRAVRTPARRSAPRT